MPDPTIIDASENHANSGMGSTSNAAAPVALVDRLRLLATERAETSPPPSRRRSLISIVAIGIVLLLGLLIFIATTVWRLHGPRSRVLDDGWYRVTDRQWGFECELPDWYTRSPRMGRPGIEYISKFESNCGTISIVAQPWSPKSSTRTATGELLAILGVERGRGAVTVLIDNSSNPTAPMIDYVVEYGTPTSPATTRRRVQIQNNVRLDITIQPTNNISASSIDRVLGTIKSTQ